MALSPRSRLGHFEIVSAIGAGGMGEVYKARDTRLDRTVAIKVLSSVLAGDPALRQRFEREARTISALDHPHICALFDIGRDNAIDYLVMQYLEGETLASRLQRGPLPLTETLTIGHQIASALAAAHRQGIVHRDLKPGNVMLTKAGARLLDFGLAKQQVPFAAAAGALTVPAGDPALTSERSILGTLQYMAPEQVEGKEADARSDMFALGTVLYEMVTGRRAFEGDSPASLVAAILTAQPSPVVPLAPETPPALVRVIDRCLAKHPDDRWQSASDLAFELRSLGALHDTTLSSSSSPPAPAVQRRSRRWRTVTIQVLAVVAAALATVLAERAFSRAYPTTAPPVELRLSIAPPTGYEFTHDVADYNPDFAVSPDGRDLAFIAVDANGTRLLWIRSLSSVAARPVLGTDGARRPFWSPDGQHVGYVGVNGLSRVPVAGGAPQLLVQLGPAMVDSNASWGASGLIAFDRFVSGSGEGARALFVVSDAGGPVRQIPRGAHHENELAQRYPTFLPDGRRFLYQSWSADPANRGIYLGSLDSEARTLIVKTGFRAEFVAPGHLLYIRDRALVAQRLSLEPPGLAGEPQVIVEGLAIEAIPGQATFAASASGVVLYRSRDRETVSELSWFDRGSRALTPAAARASDITVSLAPNGRLAATTRLSLSSAPEERPPGNLWLIDLPRGVASRLTLDPSTIDENPVWSPDGTRLAYAVHHGSSLAEVVVTSATEVSDAKTVASGSENFHPVAWSRDGRHLLLQAYATGSGGDDLDLWVLPIKAGGAPVPYIQAPFAQAQGQFSPNGRFVAYTSDESGRSEIYVRPFGVAGPRSQISPQGGSQPRWRPDGREMFYVSPAGTLTAVEVDTRSEFRASAPIALFSEPSLRANNSLFFYGGAAGYDVAPDGKRFLVNRMIRQPSGGPLQVVLNAIRR